MWRNDDLLISAFLEDEGGVCLTKFFEALDEGGEAFAAAGDYFKQNRIIAGDGIPFGDLGDGVYQVDHAGMCQFCHCRLEVYEGADGKAEFVEIERRLISFYITGFFQFLNAFGHGGSGETDSSANLNCWQAGVFLQLLENIFV